MPLCEISPEQAAFKRVDGRVVEIAETIWPHSRKTEMWSAYHCANCAGSRRTRTIHHGPWKANGRLTLSGEVIHFEVWRSGLSDSLVNAFSSDQTQGALQSPVRAELQGDVAPLDGLV